MIKCRIKTNKRQIMIPKWTSVFGIMMGRRDDTPISGDMAAWLPPSNNGPETMWLISKRAMKYMKIQVMISLTPCLAFRYPGIMDHMPPAMKPDRRARGILMMGDRSGIKSPARVAPSPPK